MELSALTLRVLLLFFPGVVCAMIVQALTNRRDRTTPEFLVDAFVYGVGTYLTVSAGRSVCAAVARMAGWGSLPEIRFFAALTNEDVLISWREIGLSAAVAVLLAAVVSATSNYHLLYRVAERLGISRKFGDPDVWTFFLNSPDIRWVVVRDPATDTSYEGAVEAFSDAGAAPAILLRRVNVFRSSTDTKLYECDRVYLSGDKSSLVIEQI